jgi:membrane protein CcdC involved in cytochrome C biogenesis
MIYKYHIFENEEENAIIPYAKFCFFLLSYLIFSSICIRNLTGFDFIRYGNLLGLLIIFALCLLIPFYLFLLNNKYKQIKKEFDEKKLIGIGV